MTAPTMVRMVTSALTAAEAAPEPIRTSDDDEDQAAAAARGLPRAGALPGAPHRWPRQWAATWRRIRWTVREPSRWRRFRPLHSGHFGARRLPLRRMLPLPRHSQHRPNGCTSSDSTQARGDAGDDQERGHGCTSLPRRPGRRRSPRCSRRAALRRSPTRTRRRARPRSPRGTRGTGTARSTRRRRAGNGARLRCPRASPMGPVPPSSRCPVPLLRYRAGQSGRPGNGGNGARSRRRSGR